MDLYPIAALCALLALWTSGGVVLARRKSVTPPVGIGAVGAVLGAASVVLNVAVMVTA